MPRKLEDPEDPYQTDDPDDGQRACGRSVIVLGQLRAQGDKVGQDGAEVDDVHHVLEEERLARGGSEAHEELEGEPADAHALDQEKGVMEHT